MNDAIAPSGPDGSADCPPSGEVEQALFEDASDGIFILDPRGRHLAANPRWAEMTGYGPAELLGMDLAQLIPPAGGAPRPLSGKEGEGPEGLPAGECVLQCADGRRLLVDLRCRRLSGGRLLGMAHDIAPRRSAEEELRQANLVVENSPAVLFRWRAEPGWPVAWVSRNVVQFGYAPEELLSGAVPFAKLVHPEDLDRVAREVREHSESGAARFQQEYRIVTREGRVRWLDDRTVVERDGSGRITSYQGVLIDITERKLAEADLNRSHQTFLTVLDGIDATIYAADLSTYEILFVNRQMVEAFGADFTGRKCHEVFRRTSAPCEFCTNPRLLDASGNPTGVVVWESQNPITGRWYINYDRAIRWVDGRMVRLQIATDVSQFKALEREREQMEAQLRQAQKMESVGRLAGGVAHDFNNMLSAILGHAELAVMQLAAPGPVRENLQAIKTAALRSAGLVRQLLAFARKQTAAPQVLDLNATVAGMITMLKRLIGEDIDLTWSPGPGLWPVKIDPSQIDQILANLCVNARDAISGVGRVAIETQNAVFSPSDCTLQPGLTPGEYVTLAVSDDGCGMPPETLPHIFEPFFTTKEMGKGTGLGLATVYGIVKQNQGHIRVDSRPGKGTVFSIHLPRFAGPVREAARGGMGPLPRGEGAMVLLVEDETAILEVAKGMLEILGYTVLAASTPEEALRLAAAQGDRLQLLLTDVVMPGMNGRQLAQRIRAINPAIGCLFTSGYTADVIAHHGVLEEGVQFIQKPFSMEELATRVHQALSGRRG
jgi:PAS domain S-box-containing protein